VSNYNATASGGVGSGQRGNDNAGPRQSPRSTTAEARPRSSTVITVIAAVSHCRRHVEKTGTTKPPAMSDLRENPARSSRTRRRDVPVVSARILPRHRSRASALRNTINAAWILLVSRKAEVHSSAKQRHPHRRSTAVAKAVHALLAWRSIGPFCRSDLLGARRLVEPSLSRARKVAALTPVPDPKLIAGHVGILVAPAANEAAALAAVPPRTQRLRILQPSISIAIVANLGAKPSRKHAPCGPNAPGP